MKKMMLMVLMLSTIKVYAQNKPKLEQVVINAEATGSFGPSQGTTEAEYNYLTKGYKIQLESGLDMKKGYTIKNLNQNYTDGYTLDFKGLYRDGESSPCAVLLIVKHEDFTGGIYYCIPHYLSSNNIWLKYWDAVTYATERRAKAIAWGLAKSAAFFAQNN